MEKRRAKNMSVLLSRIKWWTKVFILFILFTLMLYQIIAFMLPYWKAELLYPVPKGGGAVKVFSPDYIKVPKDLSNNIKQRLYLFYLLGE